MVEEHGQIVKCEPGTVAWVPFGFVAIPVYLDPDADTVRKARAIEQKTSFLTLSVCSKKLAQALPAETWKAIATYNEEHLSKHSGSKPWESRATCFKSFCVEVDER